jgi:uncharacterized membrane protein YwzB|nr:DUF1146 domain-containing protein [Bacilli bacterium]
MVKTIFYLIISCITLWALDSVRLNEIFKKNRYIQSRIIYLFITLSLSYLVVNFIYDFLRL